MPSGTGEAGRERAENCDPLSPGGTRVSETGTTRRDAGTISIDPRREAAEAETAACLRVCRRTALVTDLRHTHPSGRSEEHTSELQSLMRISYAVFCLTKKKKTTNNPTK